MTTATTVQTATRSLHVDKTHSDVSFQIRHLLSRVRGRFSEFEGTIDFDNDRPEASVVRFAIDAKSIDTNQPDRDVHLRSADFFAVDEFPQLTFVSTEITPTGADSYQVEGILTIRGVAKVVQLPVAYLGRVNDPWGNERLAFETEATINRKDFGLTWNAVLEAGGFVVGDEVKISVSLQTVAG